VPSSERSATSFDSGSYGDSYRYFGHFDPPVNGTYDVTLDAAVDYAGNDGASAVRRPLSRWARR